MSRRVRPRVRALVGALLAALVLAIVFPQAPVGMAAEPEGGTISGRVVDAEGNWVSGIEVTAWRQGTDGEIITVESNEDGFFQFTGLPAGIYNVTAIRESRIGQTILDVELDDQGYAELQFILDDANAQGGISGTVEVDLGWSAEVLFSPLEPDYHTSYHTYWWIRADENGQFAIYLPPGSFVMQALASRGDAYLSYGRHIDVPQDGPVTIPLLTDNPQRAKIQGQIQVPDNVRADAVQVRARDGREWWRASLDLEATSSYSYSIANVPAGSYVVTVDLALRTPQGFDAFYMQHQEANDLTAGESRQLDFDVQPPAIVRGRVVDKFDQPIPLAHVSASQEIGGTWLGYSETADSKGEFMIVLAPGTHRVWIESPDWSESLFFGTIDVQAGEERDLGDVRLVPDQPGPGDEEPPGDDGSEEPGGGDDQQPGDDEQQPGEDGDQQPGPGTPPPAPAPGPQPEEPRSGDRVVDRGALEDLLKQQPGDAPLVVDAELGRRVAFHAGASDTLKEAGKQAVTLNFGGPSLHVPVANLDLRELVAVNPALQDVLDDEGVEIHYAVQPSKHDRLPTGLVASGDAYDITLSVYSPSAGELPVARLAVPVTITLPVTVELNAGSSMVAVWHVRDDGSATPVPSWMTGENKVSASLTHFSTYVPAVREPAFTDTRGHWAEREIGIAYSHGIVNGKTAAMFDPDVPVTRAEFVAMLARTLGWEPDPAAATRFKDVPAGSWYAGVVGAAAKSGIVKGTTDTTFSPGYRITRLQLAVLIGRALKAQGYKLQATPDEVLARFRDAKDVGTWAREDLALAVQAGIVKGVTPHTLEPGAAATRAQVAVMLVRYLDHVFGPAGK